MRLAQVAMVSLISVGFVVGCSSGKHKSGTPADQAAVQQIRENYTSVDPHAKVGTVIAVLPDKALAAVGDLPVADFQIGDVLVLMDTKQQVIGAGHVVAKTADAVHIAYDVTAKGRAPQVGDLAVKSK